MNKKTSKRLHRVRLSAILLKKADALLRTYTICPKSLRLIAQSHSLIQANRTHLHDHVSYKVILALCINAEEMNSQVFYLLEVFNNGLRLAHC